jgi:hypothetical protein
VALLDVEHRKAKGEKVGIIKRLSSKIKS